jgi:hypothetical protein
MGDTHALSWFPAVDRLATEHGWRLLSLTKSSCSPADFRQWNGILEREYAECDTWRESTFARIEAEHPALVILANSRGFEAAAPDGTAPLEGTDRLPPWRDGMARTLARLRAAADHVVVIGDTPRSQYDVPACLAVNAETPDACATPAAAAVNPAWLGEERAVAERAGATFVDPTPWICPTGSCPPVIGSFMVLRDQQHLATRFSAALAGLLGDALPALSATGG